MSARQGDEVGLYIDVDPSDGDRGVREGDVVSTSRGRLYLVLSARLQARGLHAGTRWHLRCLVVDEGERTRLALHEPEAVLAAFRRVYARGLALDPEARLWRLRWYPR